MRYDAIENFYMIRVIEKDEMLRIKQLAELEEILISDERAKLERVIQPISAAIAFLYDDSLADELQCRGYELLPQQKNFRTINEETVIT